MRRAMPDVGRVGVRRVSVVVAEIGVEMSR